MNENSVYYAWLSGILNMDCRVKNFLLDLYKTPKEIFGTSEEDLLQVFRNYPILQAFTNRKSFAELCAKDLSAAERSLEGCQKFGGDFIDIASAEYPEHLRSLPDAPVALYLKGRKELLAAPGAAIVGTRRASPYGKWAATQLGSRIANLGVTVVSGMAEGIDSAGHRACLEKGGDTIAIFGCGIDICFPKSGEGLYRQILEKGLVVSEYAMGQNAFSVFFPMRNRIISGLSEKVFIVEGAAKSGSMVTARLALEQGRDVYAVPGNINQPNSIGCNLLIKDGAEPIVDFDLLPEIFGKTKASQRKRLPGNLSMVEQIVYKLLAASGGMAIGDLATESGLSASKALGALSSLELKGLAKVHAGCATLL